MADSPRFHHYVPNFLLMNFMCQEKLYQYDMNNKKVYIVNPGRSMGKRDYNSLENQNGSVDHDSVEIALSKIEGESAPIIEKFILNKYTASDLDAISSFIAVQIIRTPNHRSVMDSIVKAGVRSVLEIMEERNTLPDVPDSLKPFGDDLSELIDSGIINVNVKTPTYISTFSNIENLKKIINKMNRKILFYNGKSNIIIGDDPVTVFDPDFLIYRGGGGIASPRAEVILPLSSKCVFYASWDQDKYVPNYLSTADVFQINRRQAFFSERFLVSGVNDGTIEKLGSAYCGSGFKFLVNQVVAHHQMQDGKLGYSGGRRMFLNKKSERLYREKLKRIARL